MTHPVPAPPEQDTTVRTAAEILAAYAAYGVTTAAFGKLLAPWRIGPDAIGAAFRLVSRGTKHRPRQVGVGQPATIQADSELYLRAAYLIRAAQRIQTDLNAGKTLAEARRKERRHWEAHKQARRNRQDAVKRDLRLAKQFGYLLGWYLNPILANDGECLAANGNNYDVRDGTVIGRPGTVHYGCGCTSGPPWPNGGMVNDAVRGVIRKTGPVGLKPRPRKGRRT